MKIIINIKRTKEDNQVTQSATRTKIVFNGIEYESSDEMPSYVRNLYEQAMNAAHQVTDKTEREHRPVATGLNRQPPNRPFQSARSFSWQGSFSSWCLAGTCFRESEAEGGDHKGTAFPLDLDRWKTTRRDRQK